MNYPRPHLSKLEAAIQNQKCSKKDVILLKKAKALYEDWINKTTALTSTGRRRVEDLVDLLNNYKDALEVELIAKKGSPFLKRQKGQMKLDNSVLEEFLPYLVCPEIINGLNHSRFEVGPQKAFMSLSFMPHSFDQLGTTPEIVVKLKDQDFVIGSRIHYKFSAESDFQTSNTSSGEFSLAVLAAECKVNLDKTMFQEAAGTASRLKQGCPVAKYFVLVEYLDMPAEDTRLTSIDNVFLFRKAKRLPFEKRAIAQEVEAQHKNFPILSEVVWLFCNEIQKFVDATWYDPDAALQRGSFVE